MKRDYDQLYANCKADAKNYTIEQLEELVKGIDKEIDELLDKHECLAAKKKAYKRVIKEKQQEES